MTKKKTQIVNKFTGSMFWLIFWVIIFWPIALVYYFNKKRPVEVEVLGS